MLVFPDDWEMWPDGNGIYPDGGAGYRPPTRQTAILPEGEP